MYDNINLTGGSNRMSIIDKKLKKLLDRINSSPTEIKKINLSEYRELLEFPIEIKSCKVVSEIDISFSGIEKLPEFFYSFTSLKKVNFIGCKNLIIDYSKICGLKKLEEISIYVKSTDNITKLLECLGQLSIKKLVINGEVETIPNAIEKLENLLVFEIFSTKVKTLPLSISRLTKLKSIKIWQSIFSPKSPYVDLELEEIFNVLSKCKKLKEVDLTSNNITVLPDNINQLEQIKKLLLKKNGIIEVNTKLFDLTQLEYLDLSVNQISLLPYEISKLINLKCLLINANWKNNINIINLLENIENFTQLKELNLSSCQIELVLPDNMKQLQKLLFLDLDNNNLTEFPNVLYKLKSLKKIRFGKGIFTEEIKQFSNIRDDVKIIV